MPVLTGMQPPLQAIGPAVKRVVARRARHEHQLFRPRGRDLHRPVQPRRTIFDLAPLETRPRWLEGRRRRQTFVAGWPKDRLIWEGSTGFFPTPFPVQTLRFLIMTLSGLPEVAGSCQQSARIPIITSPTCTITQRAFISQISGVQGESPFLMIIRNRSIVQCIRWNF